MSNTNGDQSPPRAPRSCSARVFPVPQLIYGGDVDFLVFDYLSEITMSLLTASRTKSPVSQGGWAA